MKWESLAIIIKIHKFSERDAIVTALTRERGFYRSVAKGVLSKKHRGIWQPGNLVYLNWSARLDEHMGNIYGELSAPYAALVMNDRTALSFVNSALALLPIAIMERDPHPVLYDALANLLQSFASGDDSSLKDYAYYEYMLLQESGFGLDLSCCAATGEVEDLMYISPKSGRAVSAGAGEKYKDRLLPLPPLLLGWNSGQANHQSPEKAEILDILKVTGYFIKRYLCESNSLKVPKERTMIEEMIEKDYVLAQA